jgi:hypothetical protein
MPCDLAPIISDSMAVRASAGLFVAFSTNTVSAPEVGSALGDELEQLGFAVESVSDSAVEARRSDGNLRVSLVTEPGELKREGIRVYPTLPPASIVVEFESI